MRYISKPFCISHKHIAQGEKVLVFFLLHPSTPRFCISWWLLTWGRVEGGMISRSQNEWGEWGPRQGKEVSAFLHFYDLREQGLLAQVQGMGLPLCLWHHVWGPGLCQSLEEAVGCESQTVLLLKWRWEDWGRSLTPLHQCPPADSSWPRKNCCHASWECLPVSYLPLMSKIKRVYIYKAPRTVAGRE